MSYPHSLRPEDYADSARTVLRGMLQKQYPSDNIAEVQRTLESLHTHRKAVAAQSKLKFKNPECRAILEAMHMAAKLWADLWEKRGPEILQERLTHYREKTQGLRAKAIDQLLYDALLAKKEESQ